MILILYNTSILRIRFLGLATAVAVGEQTPRFQTPASRQPHPTRNLQFSAYYHEFTRSSENILQSARNRAQPEPKRRLGNAVKENILQINLIGVKREFSHNSYTRRARRSSGRRHEPVIRTPAASRSYESHVTRHRETIVQLRQTERSSVQSGQGQSCPHLPVATAPHIHGTNPDRCAEGRAMIESHFSF